MTREQHWDDPERISQRAQAMPDPNPHLRRDSYVAARLSREVEDIQRAEPPSWPTNFLPIEERITTTTPAGESAYTIPDPRPEARTDTATEALRRAVFAREIEARGQLSGSHDQHARTRTFDLPAFVPVRRLDAAGRVEDINWARAHRQPD